MDTPSPKTGPNQVRAYLADLLVRRHDVNPESAQSTADRWQLGLGRDLRNANEVDFIRIFGKPVGPYLYRSVDDDLYAEWRVSISGIFNYWALRIACVATIFFAAHARYSQTTREAEQNWKCAAFCGPIIMIGAIRECMHNANFIFILLSVLGGIMTFFAFIILFVA